MNPRHLSLSNEHYSPPEVVAAAREVMGGIDLDPATSEVGARLQGMPAFYDLAANGFDRPWRGRVFLNPPGGKCSEDGVPLAKKDGEKGWFRVDDGTRAKPFGAAVEWWRKLANEYGAGTVTEALYVGFSLEILQKAQQCSPSPLDFWLCFPRRRLDYYREAFDGNGDVTLVEQGSPPHASVLVYLPPFGLSDRFGRRKVFFEQFEKIGRCLAP